MILWYYSDTDTYIHVDAIITYTAWRATYCTQCTVLYFTIQGTHLVYIDHTAIQNRPVDNFAHPIFIPYTQ